jgi:YVTN family beta-propeller protein
MRFVATLSAAYPQPVSFDYATAPGTALPADFQPISGQATFPAGQTQVFIDVLINGNTVPQSDRYLLLNLGNAPFARITTPQVRGLILDDDRDAYLSPVALVADTNRARLYVAEQTVSRVVVVDLNTDTLGQTFPLPDAPNGLALSPDAARLYVAAGVAEGRIFVLDALTGDLLQTLAVGHTPMSPVVSPDGARLYVCNRFNDDVSVMALASGATVARIPVARQPHAVALTPDGRRLFVANLLPSGPATNLAVAGVVSVVDTTANAVVATVRLPVGAHSLRGLCVAPDGAHVFVTHVLSRFYVPTTQVTRGWMNTAALSIIDVARGALVNTVLLDDLDLGAANPWGVACTADGQYLCVAHAGTHEISVIDRSALLTRLPAGGADVPQDLTYLASLRRRLPLKGNGPRAIALVGTKLYAAEFFSDSVGVVDLAPGQEYGAKEIVVGWQKPATGARLGERHYNDATLCLQHWQSCASCHPDARSDSLNWDLINDGFGSPKNSKSHLYSMQTPPAMATGIRANAPVAVRAGFKYIEFLSQPEACAEAVDTFLTSLTPTPSPYLVNGALSAAATRGQAHFETRGCAQCHSGPYLTDGQKHDLGTATAREPGVLFDTPTLREIWRTAPYLHDGRAATVREVITTVHAARVSGLSEAEIDDLTAYVLSL